MKKNKRKSKYFNVDEKGYAKDNLKNVVVDMNDIKGLFREWMMMNFESEFEKVVKDYVTNNVLKDSKNDEIVI